MALIPTLASQILEDMDVEALTNELQSISRASRSRSRLPPHTQDRSQSVASSVTDAHSDAGSVSLSSYSGSAHDADRGPSSALGSWVEHMSTSDGHRAPHNFLASTGAELSDSITSTSSSLSHNGHLTHSMESSMFSNSTRTKRQLWNEIKILGGAAFVPEIAFGQLTALQALTRTLTTLYTTTLLTLLSVVQITLLGRGRYIESVRASERAERTRDRVPPFSLTEILAREAIASVVDVEAIWPAWLFGEDNDEDDEFSDGKVEEALSEETELRYLTLSWWILHVGWKDVAGRVRGSVESVFEG
jgi:peroxin-3